MQPPTDPVEHEDPSDNQNPLEDPMLGAFERSIKNPPGFTDPPAEKDELYMDNLAKQLDEVESSIENALPLQGEGEPDAFDDDAAVLEKIPPAEGYECSEAEEEPQDGSEDTQPSDLQEPADNANGIRIQLPKLPGRRGGNIRGRRGYSSKRRLIRRVGRMRIRKGSNLRFCPESHDLIDQQKCDTCEKYRHWPEGTKEKPRECWYDWQARPRIIESEDNVDKGD